MYRRKIDIYVPESCLTKSKQWSHDIGVTLGDYSTAAIQFTHFIGKLSTDAAIELVLLDGTRSALPPASTPSIVEDPVHTSITIPNYAYTTLLADAATNHTGMNSHIFRCLDMRNNLMDMGAQPPLIEHSGDQYVFPVL